MADEFLVQITITNIDRDEVVKSESRIVPRYVLTDSSEGLSLVAGTTPAATTSTPASGPDLSGAMSIGLKLFNGLKAASDRAQAAQAADTSGTHRKTDGNGCCGQ